MKKKVLILNPYLPTMGGGEKHMGFFCQSIEAYFDHNVSIDILVHDYYDVHVDAPNYVTIDELNKVFGTNLCCTGIRKIYLEKEDGSMLPSVKNKRMIENITGEYDLFINFMFLSKHIGKAKKNIYQCMFPPHRFVQDRPGATGLKKLVLKYWDYQFYHSYDAFVCNSQFTNHWLGTYWKVTPKNTFIYPPVFDTEDVASGKYDEMKKENIIISVGRFFVAGHSKRQLDMVRFFVNNQDKLRDCEYHLVGSISESEQDREYFRQIEAEASKVNNVFFHIRMPSDELAKLYARAKIFWHATGYGIDENVNPEQMEHFGITTVEAMNYGAVPVVINKGGQKETVEDGVNGYLWNTEEECVSRTYELITNEELRQKMAQCSVERAKSFTIDKFIKDNLALFEKMSL